eukprot:TRINITY_DN28618_c0_g1_i1.p1 TRINITY_DN28618_c0_g1~~TRINITY_DN28618_c0_g1_i1.p1  ORF type:complete len:324 (-),score=59.08 TRINITY_DN28618_c0_g1_i1:62-1033(-)
MAKPLVTITGISGYVGAHCALTFLKDGSYRVRGTVRSTKNEAKLKPIKDAFGALFDELELAEADLNNEESIINACEGATYIVHTASPYTMAGGSVEPAVAGTMAAMKAATKHGVKRVVVTSSCAAVLAATKFAPLAEGASFDETMWNDVEFLKSGALPAGPADYLLSKTLAERAAWDYQKDNPGFELVTILPYYVYGPSLLGGNGESESSIKAVLDGSKGKIPRGGQHVVDVRDIALAHLKAVQVPEAAGNRIIACNTYVTWKQVYDWLAQKGSKVPTEMDDGEDKKPDQWNNDKSKKLLGIEYTQAESTFVDMAESLIAFGL